MNLAETYCPACSPARIFPIAIGFGAMLISLVIGVPLGLLAAFHRGLVETAIMRTVDLLISLPPVLLGLLILAVTPPSLVKTIIAVGLAYIPSWRG